MCKGTRMPDLELAQKIVDMLNGALEMDKAAIAALIANRVPCRAALADHPTIQVAKQHEGYHVGLLGILNGLCGVFPDDAGPICAIFQEDAGENWDDLDRFEVVGRKL